MFSILNKYIRLKLSFFVLILLVGTTFAFYIITIKFINKQIVDEVIKRAEALSQSIAASAGYSFLSKDLLGLDNIVFQLKESNPDVVYLAIIEPDNKVIVHSDIKKKGEHVRPAQGKILEKRRNGMSVMEVRGEKGTIFEIIAPIIFMEAEVGAVILGINKSVLENAQGATRHRILQVFAVILCLGILGILFLSSLLTRPIHELSDGVKELKEGKRRRLLNIYSKDELGRLTESFNEMGEQITDQKQRLNEAALELEESYVSTVRVMAATIDARDPYTHGHSSRVANLALEIAKSLDMDKEEMEDLEVTCLFHDIGKIKISDAILQKKRKLTASEYQEMKRHVEYGVDILAKAPSLYKYISAVRHHHERYDGRGYPDGLEKEQIPLFSAIIAIADAYDAMTSSRPYRKALQYNTSIKRITEFSGQQFDPELVQIFLRIMESDRILPLIKKHEEIS